MNNCIKLEDSKLYYENGVYLGEILAKEDGFYDFWPELRGGYWEAHVLRAIADLLDEKNKPWQESIDKYFEEQSV